VAAIRRGKRGILQALDTLRFDVIKVNLIEIILVKIK
jgi:hypothetical protein